MSEWYDNRSAEVVLRQPRDSSNAHTCLDKCLKRLKPEQVQLLLRAYGDRRELNNLAAFRGVSVFEMKKVRSRLVKCIKKCVEEAEDKAFPT
jgi:DNA-directed RNA polymerase specialized sigma24 family protein